MYLHELKMNRKNLLIWTICVGGICFACILMYTSLEGSLSDMAASYANMGAFSTAFGMDKISIATLPGFYATEIGLMHSIGGAMFAALIGVSILSKEENGHTTDFLFSMPQSRIQFIVKKYLALVTNILFFNFICVVFYVLGFFMMGEDIPQKAFVCYHIAQFLMHLEIGSIAFLVSACTSKNLVGVGLGIALLGYAADVMCRLIPAIENMKYVTPFYYSNGADIFTTERLNGYMIGIGIIITIVVAILGGFIYYKKDLAS